METCYFLDDRIIQPQKTRDFAHRAAKAMKDLQRNPLFGEGFFETPAKPWEVRYDNAYPNVICDPDQQQYRVYYADAKHDCIQSGEKFCCPARRKPNARSQSLVEVD